MNREKILKSFCEQEIPREREKLIQELDRCFESDRELLMNDFLSSFRDLCLQIKQRQQLREDKKPIGYITYSMLRTELVEGKSGESAYLVEAANKSWFLDRKPICSTYNAKWALRHVDEMMERLEVLGRSYAGVVTSMELSRIRLREMGVIHGYVAALIRYAMSYAIATTEFKEIAKEDEFEVRVGEYFDASECVYKEDGRLLRAEDVKAWLNEKNEHEYTYHVFGNLDLSDGEYDDLDFRFTMFKGTKFEGASFNRCVLIGTNWDASNLAGADFSESIMCGADFSRNNLKNAVFRGVEAGKGRLLPEWRGPGFDGINFTGSDLRGVDFRDAHLEGAIFKGAQLNGALFAGADLTGVTLEGAQLDGLDLGGMKGLEVI